MALITTPGDEEADSYVSVAEADLYCISYGYTAWDALDDDDDKGPLLRKATAYLDNQYRGQWKGKATSATQALAWPRDGATNEDFRPIDDDVIPRVLKHAAIEAAVAENASPGTLFPQPNTTDRLTKMERVGPIEVMYEPGAVAQTEIDAVADLVLGLLIGGGGTTGFLKRA